MRKTGGGGTPVLNLVDTQQKDWSILNLSIIMCKLNYPTVWLLYGYRYAFICVKHQFLFSLFLFLVNFFHFQVCTPKHLHKQPLKALEIQSSLQYMMDWEDRKSG